MFCLFHIDNKYFVKIMPVSFSRKCLKFVVEDERETMCEHPVTQD